MVATARPIGRGTLSRLYYGLGWNAACFTEPFSGSWVRCWAGMRVSEILQEAEKKLILLDVVVI